MDNNKKSNKIYKNILLVGDICGIGKVSLSPINTIISSAGFETSLLPTTILSSHTGGFESIYIYDYSLGMEKFIKQWKSINIHFDAIITSYFRNANQIKQVIDFKKQNQCKQSILIVDPVMADNGKLYSGLTEKHVENFRKLCKMAELIMPNFTEANLIANTNLDEKSTNIDEIKQLILKLVQLGYKNVIITGIKLENNIVIAYFDNKEQKFEYEKIEKIGSNFFGTGDIFTAVVSTCFIKNMSLKKSISLASKWINKCLLSTVKLNRDIKYGVCFEPHLGELIKILMEE